MYKMSPADMKLAASEAYRRQDYITAMKLYTRVFLSHYVLVLLIK